MNVADQFKGLPMSDLIGGPLKAACEANVLMAKATSDFINNIGFNRDKDGKVTDPRMVDFSYERPSKDKDGNPALDLVKIKVPILAIVPIPNLQVNNVDITFDMEVKSSTSAKESDSKKGSLEASASGSFGAFKADVKISGSVSSSKDNTRSSDASAKYHVEVSAINSGLPEGLARVLDMMNQSAQPRQVQQYKMDKDGNKIGDPTAVNNEGEPIKKVGAGDPPADPPANPPVDPPAKGK